LYIIVGISLILKYHGLYTDRIYISELVANQLEIISAGNDLCAKDLVKILCVLSMNAFY
jgi:hypothetical protein